MTDITNALAQVDETRAELLRVQAADPAAEDNYSSERDAYLGALENLADAVRADQDPGVMPAAVHGEPVVSAFRHLPPYGRTDDTYTVITLSEGGPEDEQRYCVFRARFAPTLGRWSIDTDYAVDSDLPWRAAASEFAERVTQRVN
jgi:hypothetical protein